MYIYIYIYVYIGDLDFYFNRNSGILLLLHSIKLLSFLLVVLLSWLKKTTGELASLSRIPISTLR